MATKKAETIEKVNEEIVEEVKAPAEPNPYERIPYTLEINWENPKEKVKFISYNDYSAYIEVGKEVWIPRWVVKNIEQQKADDRAAKLKLLRMQEDYINGKA